MNRLKQGMIINLKKEKGGDMAYLYVKYSYNVLQT